MLRQGLLYLSGQERVRRWMERSKAARKLTSRFIAGRTLEEEVRLVSSLAKDGIASSLDFLGENVTTLEEADRSKESYLEALAEIGRLSLPSTISVKLTQVGLGLSTESCLRNVSVLVERARCLGTRVEIDMESSEFTERTVQIVCRLQERYPGSVRAVIQAYLHRSEADIKLLSGMKIPVRLCKGAYREPASVAFPSKEDVDRNYLKLLEMLLSSGTHPAIASHDERIIRYAIAFITDQSIAFDRLEFQMLYGIRRDLQKELVQEGFHLRLYVPYGQAWYPYFMRRLAERPANALFLLRNLVRR